MLQGLRVRGVARTALAAGGVAAAAAVVAFAPPARDAHAVGPPLTRQDVIDLVGRCVQYAKRVGGKPKLTIAVVDAEGNSLGVFRTAGSTGDTAVALAKAGTGAYFSSDFGSFTTRTAAFIIQDHFPPGVRFVPGGPLYGVQFSSLASSDVNPVAFPTVASPETRVRGDLGGIGLYKNDRRVGGLGVDDGRIGSRVGLPPSALTNCRDKYRITFGRLERGRRMERVVHAAARGYLPSRGKRAGTITVDGIRLEYRKPVALGRAKPRPLSFPDDPADFDPDVHDGVFEPGLGPRDAAGIASRFTALTIDPPPGSSPAAQSFTGQTPVAFPIRGGTDGLLSEADVRRILWQGAQRANVTRAAIRRPVGRVMECWVSVVDTRGEVLGVFRFRDDATLFSYDVSVQKARTAAFFSDQNAAFSTRALGLMAQRFYPAGQQGKARGPLYQLQDGLSVAQLAGSFGPNPGRELLRIRNGITIFPGGVPLYRGGALVGGVGVSGDGVDQDDVVADYAARGYGAPKPIRCDRLGRPQLRSALQRAMTRLAADAPPDPGPGTCDPGDLPALGLSFFHARLNRVVARLRLIDFSQRPPYVKYPRHPGPVTIR
jgi:uncharacterized protein GlcG (DUF336 family)